MSRLMEQILEQLEELKDCDMCSGMTCIECETKYGDSVDCDTIQQYLTIDKCKAIVQKTIKECEDVCRYQPTAYNPDKVVAKLEELKDSFEGEVNFGTRELLKLTIEIVKQGGVRKEIQ